MKPPVKLFVKLVDIVSVAVLVLGSSSDCMVTITAVIEEIGLTP